MGKILGLLLSLNFYLPMTSWAKDEPPATEPTHPIARIVENKCSEMLSGELLVTEHAKWAGKTLIFDTNVVLNDPFAIYKFPGARIIISASLRAEVNEKKSHPDLGLASRTFTRELLDLMRRAKTNKDIPLIQVPGTLTVDLNSYTQLLEGTGLDPSTHDNKILALARHYVDEVGAEKVVLITDDGDMNINAIGMGIPESPFLMPGVEPLVTQDGKMMKYELSDAAMETFLQSGAITKPDDLALAPNEFVMFFSPSHPEGDENIGRFRFLRDNPDDQKIHKLLNLQVPDITAPHRNIEQQMLMDVIEDKSIDLVFVVGGPGTGKTFNHMNAAVRYHDIEKEDRYESYVLSRPTIPFGYNHPGAYPGDDQQKNAPYKKPFINNLNSLNRIKFELERNRKALDKQGRTAQFKKANPGTEAKEKQNGGGPKFKLVTDLPAWLTWQTYELFRGISLDYAFVGIDEGQNTNATQMWDILTRIGKGTKMIVMGDPTQLEDGTRRFVNSTNNGLAVAVSALTNSQLSFSDRSHIAVIHLIKAERSEITEVLNRAKELAAKQ